jgi:hypothetical protein
MLRTSGIGKRKFLHAEHCGYGTRDLPLIEPYLFRRKGSLHLETQVARTLLLPAPASFAKEHEK